MSKELETAGSKDLEVKKAGALASFLVDDQTSVVGFEDMDSSTRAVPFIKVLNKMSPELDDSSASYMEGAKQGDIINTVTKENYGKSIDVTCIKFEHIVIEWKPNRGGFAGYHSPEEAQKLTFDASTFGHHKTKEGNELSDTYMYYFVINTHLNDGVVVFAADSADIKEGKKLNAEMCAKFDANNHKAKPFQQIYNMRTEQFKNDNGSWFKPVYTFAGFIQNQEVYTVVKDIMNALADAKVDYSKVDNDGEDTGASSSTAKDDLSSY